jgi:hypothetical protein
MLLSQLAASDTVLLVREFYTVTVTVICSTAPAATALLAVGWLHATACARSLLFGLHSWSKPKTRLGQLPEVSVGGTQ